MVDGLPVAESRWQRQKPKLLLKALALQPHHQLHREQLMEILWPEHDPETAAQNMHRSIYIARRALEPDLASGGDSHFVLTRGQQVLLRAPGELWIDVAAFEQQAEAASLGADVESYEEALSLYRGELLIEDLYQDWAVMRRERLSRLRRSLLVKLARLYGDGGQYRRGLERLNELVASDPLDEEAHRQAMSLHALAGDRQQAVQQYRLCREMLAREIGAEPEPATIALYEQIVAGKLPPSPSKLAEERRSPWARRRGGNTAARTSYLKGLYHWNRMTPEGFEKAIECFEQALAIDPGFAAAHAGLADCYNVIALGFYTWRPPAALLRRAKTAALRALELDAELVEAHAALGRVKMAYDWDWAGAERAFRRALELDPHGALAYNHYAVYLAAMGRLEEALVAIARAQELDPLSLIIDTNWGNVLLLAGRPEQAIEHFQAVLELAPAFPAAHRGLGWAYELQGRCLEAIAQFEREGAVAGDRALPLGSLGHVYAALGRGAEARALLSELIDLSARHYVPPVPVAAVYAALGEDDRAFTWLEKACDDRCVWVPFLKVHPFFARLRSHPRFIALLRRVGLAPGPAPRPSESLGSPRREEFLGSGDE